MLLILLLSMLLITRAKKHQSPRLFKQKCQKLMILPKFNKSDPNLNWLMMDLNWQSNLTMLKTWSGPLTPLNFNLKDRIKLIILWLKHSKLKLRSMIMSQYLSLKLLDGIILKSIKLTLGSLLNLINLTPVKTQSFMFKLMLSSLAIKIKSNGLRLYT